MAETEPEPVPAKHDSGDESEDESEVLEESPCGRWQKRREEVEQRDVPGIDNAFLAMDTDEGMEVVWNEVQFSQKKDFRAQQDKIRQVFDNLIQLDHPNIVKFHKYWTDTTSEKPRVIFITEYMSSGSLKQFLKKTKKNNKTFQLKSWKKWCTQILSALSYLHSCKPPIIHGNLTCDTVFIQHNGLIKIGSVAPDAIHHHVKTYRDDLKNMHFIAPEYGSSSPLTTEVDVYAFGMCALEMAALETHSTEDSGAVTQEAITKTLDSLEDKSQRNLIELCLEKNPLYRPTARILLFHRVLFEVHSLKLLAAHRIVANSNLSEDISLTKTDPSTVIAELSYQEKREPMQIKFSQVFAVELEKLLEDVKNGIYPLTAFALQPSIPTRARAVTPEVAESVKSDTPEPFDMETRLVVNISCQVRPSDDKKLCHLTLLLRMDDRMNRQLQCDITTTVDTPLILAEELVHNGFINELDRDKVATVIDEQMKNRENSRTFVDNSSVPIAT